MGRFLQRDVHASGLPILSTLAYAGDPLEPAADPFDPQAHYTDGLHLFAFATADPVKHTDPLGPFIGDFGIGSLIGIDLNLDRAMDGLDTVSALRGFALMVAIRNVQLDAFADMAAAGQIDTALAFITQANRANRALLLTAGALTAGAVTLKGLSFAADRLGRLSVRELERVAPRWYRSTFRTVEDSIVYHWKKHAQRRGVSVWQYTQDALGLWEQRHNKGFRRIKLGDGTEGIKIYGKTRRNLYARRAYRHLLV